jgi:hypothetical protein
MATNQTPHTYVRLTDQTRPRSVKNMSLLYEALSRARMRRPQIVRSEATNDQSRGALRVAMESRSRQARERAHHWD